MNKLVIILIVVFYSFGFAQKSQKPIIYVDEKMQQLNQADYSLQLLKSIYREETIQKDSVTIKRLQSLYEFNSLAPSELLQVQSILKKYLNINDFQKTIIIVYRDSLLGYEEFVSSFSQKKAYDAIDLDSEKKYLERRNSFDSKQKKCIKFASKNNVKTIYGYSDSLNFTYKPKHYTNTKIPSILKSLFFKNRKRGTLLLKPDGNYFFYSYLTQKQLLRMLNSNWNSYIKDYNEVKNNDDVYSMKFIEEMKIEQRKDMRALAKTQVNKVYKRRGNSQRDYSTRKIRIKPPINCFGYASY